MNAPCTICKRQARGLAFMERDHPAAEFCTLECSEVYMANRSRKLDFLPGEDRAIEEGGAQAGEYLDSIGKTDLASLTKDEWAEFCKRLIAGYTDDLALQAREAVPF